MGDALDDAEQMIDELEEKGYSEGAAMFFTETCHKPDELSMLPHLLDHFIKERIKRTHESRLEACKAILIINAETTEHMGWTKDNVYREALTIPCTGLNCHKVVALAARRILNRTVLRCQSESKKK